MSKSIQMNREWSCTDLIPYDKYNMECDIFQIITDACHIVTTKSANIRIESVINFILHSVHTMIWCFSYRFVIRYHSHNNVGFPQSSAFSYTYTHYSIFAFHMCQSWVFFVTMHLLIHMLFILFLSNSIPFHFPFFSLYFVVVIISRIKSTIFVSVFSYDHRGCKK